MEDDCIILHYIKLWKLITLDYIMEDYYIRFHSGTATTPSQITGSYSPAKLAHKISHHTSLLTTASVTTTPLLPKIRFLQESDEPGLGQKLTFGGEVLGCAAPIGLCGKRGPSSSKAQWVDLTKRRENNTGLAKTEVQYI